MSTKLSIIITAHDEGILAHKMILSIFHALKQVSASYEIVVHIDNGAPETLRYFDRYCSDSRFHILKSHFGDLGKSRNFAVSQSAGEYIIFVDADDLISEHYLSSMLEALESATTPALVHPSYVISYQDTHFQIWQTLSSCSRNRLAFCLFSRNQWPSPCAARRDLFLEHPYISTSDGYGHEDYALNIEVAAHSVPHLTAPCAVYFYRQKRHSLMRSNDANHVTQPYSSLFDYKIWRTFPEPSSSPTPQPDFKQKLRKFSIAVRGSKVVNALVSPLVTVKRKIDNPKVIQPKTHPACVEKACRDIATIEPVFGSVSWSEDAAEHYDPNQTLQASTAYLKLSREITNPPDTVFILSRLPPDSKLYKYLCHFCSSHPEQTYAIITTLPSNAVTLPDNVFQLHFGDVLEEIPLEWWDQELLFTRLVVQLQPKTLCLSDSDYGCQWAASHAVLIEKHFSLDVLFMPEKTIENFYTSQSLVEIYHLIRHVYSDDQDLLNRLDTLDAFDPRKFKIIPKSSLNACPSSETSIK